MKLEERNDGEILVVSVLDERLDAQAVDDFKRKMYHHIENGNKLIVLNLANVAFIDSSGLGAIVSVLKMLKDQGKLVICCAGDAVMRMFRLTRMNKVFNMFGSEQEALEAI